MSTQVSPKIILTRFPHLESSFKQLKKEKEKEESEHESKRRSLSPNLLAQIKIKSKKKDSSKKPPDMLTMLGLHPLNAGLAQRLASQSPSKVKDTAQYVQNKQKTSIKQETPTLQGH